MRHETPTPVAQACDPVPRPAIPDHLFVGAIQGVAACSEDNEIYEVWPKFIVMVLLQGAQHFVMDDQDFRIDAGDEADPRPLVFMLNVARFCALRFINDSPVPLKKIMISAPRPWLDRLVPEERRSTPELRAFFSSHLSRFSFEPNRQIQHLAGQILDPPPALRDEIQALNRRAHALEIMTGALAALAASTTPGSAKPSYMSLRQSQEVRDYLIANVNEDLTVETIARAVGQSSSTMQRHFKDHFGITVYDFIRNRRLEMAREALANEGISIGRAAFMAGYSSTSSFTTAFKRAFGVTPRTLRR
ncbi:DNA-binding domain-containing protein, AraC-type [uncultured Pleomorphomonas sp.]|uniref:DNA-binding domain-containing protein, AraC-type n=1 Tax=uncultured Pleomorphomonas sp. TaxID=442121 RepID=A0A212LPQ3_9HYPH|nr:AraC family transcriptional regulator [uncultured Pleomorphomonas sp.]SCM79451.1 DNA-binding domain-containing protein, AraC-type [uncultured Pleomorphomonas sp.]